MFKLLNCEMPKGLTYFVKEMRGELIDLRGKTGASIHDKSPEIRTRGNTADEQTIFIAFLNVLIKSCICHVVMIPEI